jgi:hypothetical protein
MLPGPVFEYELIASSRRKATYIGRFVYGLVLLAMVAQHCLAGWGATRTASEASWLGRRAFVLFVIVQGIAVILLTPALVAGAIAEERQRRSLDDLLTTRLTGGAIVLGKGAARLLHLAMYVAIGLPIMSLMALFGGVDPPMLLLAYAGTASTALFLAALSLLVSTEVRKVREALSLAYGLGLGWLIVPVAIAEAVPRAWPVLYREIEPVNTWVGSSGPLWALRLSALLSKAGSLEAVAPPKDALWMVGLQLAAATGMASLAVWRLRPAQRRLGAGEPARARGPWRWRLWARPAVGDDPMLWKECHTSRTTGVAKLVAAAVVLLLLAGLAALTYNLAAPAFRELLASGYGPEGVHRRTFNIYLRLVGTGLALVLTLGVARNAAVGITAEREEQTWASLLATTLESATILRAKMLGAAWGFRGGFAVLVVLWALGVAAGAVHPLGPALVLVELAVFAWFSAALGTYLSLVARSSRRAQLLAVGTWLLCNGGYLLFLRPFLVIDRPLAAVGVTPWIAAVSLLMNSEVSPTREAIGLVRNGLYSSPAILALTCVLGTVGYAAAALALTRAALRRFDALADRPRRPVAPAAPAAPERPARLPDGLPVAGPAG